MSRHRVDGLLIRRGEVAGRPLDVRVRAGKIVEVGVALDRAGEVSIDAVGGALLPGLHDHHLHLFSLAAWLQSVRCGPPEVGNREGLAEALRAAAEGLAPGVWIRGVGYHRSVAGDLDRHGLDALLRDRPVRLQDRSGALWILNSAGVAAVGLARDPPPGAERDEHGAFTGRLRRADDWLRNRVSAPKPDLGAVGNLLAAAGVTAVTDATPQLDPPAVELLAQQVRSRAIPQRVTVMGADQVPAELAVGPKKIVLDEFAGLDNEALERSIAAAHRGGRPVAIHCVTGTEVVVAVSGIDAAGALLGDRLEHASVTPDALDPTLRHLGVTIVTQPNFVAERGDDYLSEMRGGDLASLYRARTLLAFGVPLAGGTDAPFGRPDPWEAIRAAVERRTRAGRSLGAGEALAPATALSLFLGPIESPGGPARVIATGRVADLCLLDRPLHRALAKPDSRAVRLTIVGGAVVFDPSGSAEG